MTRSKQLSAMTPEQYRETMVQFQAELIEYLKTRTSLTGTVYAARAELVLQYLKKVKP
jgi:hypothetical protein